MELPSPFQLKKEYPLSCEAFIQASRKRAQNILRRSDDRLVIIVGPCSIHDPKAALEYATLLKQLMPRIEKTFFPILRFFIEKPRTRLGWKGMLYDPFLNGSNDIATGLRQSRELLLQISELGVPCAMEFLEPIAAPYFEDLIVWGLVGARTSASQTHRQMASGLPFPIGFKNDCEGKLDSALSAILSSRTPHSYIGINAQGHVASIHSQGNPHSHLVLRGSANEPNYDPLSVENALTVLRKQQIESALLIDCSHGNCGKDHQRQKIAFESVFHQAKNNRFIAGLMLESHLFSGSQRLQETDSPLEYGVSITDPCIGWEETEFLLSMSMS